MAEDANSSPSPAEQVSHLYDELEARSAKASEEIVGGSGFAVVLARVAENTAALTKLSGDALDLALRNLRLAGRRDIISLARQLARTEDKLERVLQEVEELRDELSRAASGPEKTAKTANDGRSQRAPARRRKASS